MTPLLEVSSLSCGYHRREVLRGVNLYVKPGEIVSVVGPNGAGKTTMLNALMGLHPATGLIKFLGRDLGAAPAESRLETGLCLVAEKRELFGSMSVEDNLQLGAFIRRKEGRYAIGVTLQAVFARFPRLRERRTQLAGTLSGGERQMLAIGRAMMSAPKLLMMDEPSLGLAPRIVDEMFEIILDLRASGVSILLVEQNARSALAISSRAYVLELGEVVMQGDGHELAKDPRIVESYLGLTAP